MKATSGTRRKATSDLLKCALAQAIHNRPPLWDSRSGSRNPCYCKAALWWEVAQAIGRTVKGVKSLWKTMVVQRKKCVKGTATPKRKYLEQMEFVDADIARPTSSSTPKMEPANRTVDAPLLPSASCSRHDDTPFTSRGATDGDVSRYNAMTNGYTGYTNTWGENNGTETITQQPGHPTHPMQLSQPSIKPGMMATHREPNATPMLTELPSFHPTFGTFTNHLQVNAHQQNTMYPAQTNTPAIMTTSLWSQVLPEDILFLQVIGLNLARLVASRRQLARSKIFKTMWKVEFPEEEESNADTP